jgi:FtsH-binding integral membrane protein
MAYQFQPQTPSGGTTTAAPTRSLLGQVLGLTAVGLALTATSAWLFQDAPYGFGLIAMIVGFVLLFVINRVRENETLALILFYGFTFLWGIGLAPTIGHYNHTVGPDVIVNAAVTTGMGMAALGAIVYGTGLDLRRFQGIFMLALLGLILVSIVAIFVHFIHPQVISYLTLVIFTGLVLIDFARIRAGGDGLTPIQMALAIYLDAINIFLALLRIFGGRR